MTLNECVNALSFLNESTTVIGGEIRITLENHETALRVLREARNALAVMEKIDE